MIPLLFSLLTAAPDPAPVAVIVDSARPGADHDADELVSLVCLALIEAGVPRDQVLQQLAKGIDVYVRTDVQGAATIRRLMPDALLIFVAPASFDDLEARIRARGAEGESEILQRIEAARAEMARQTEFEYVIVNQQGRLDTAADQLERIVAAEHALRA